MTRPYCVVGVTRGTGLQIVRQLVERGVPVRCIVFDYGRDPWGQKHEHYADGDLFDASQEPGYRLMDREGLYQLGPDLPDDFIDAKLAPRRLWTVLKTAMNDKAALKKCLH
jgi:hypothetical protein